MLLVLAMLFGVQPAYADDEPDTANLSWAITTDPQTGQLTSAKVDFPGGTTFREYSARVFKDGALVWESGVQMQAPYDATEAIQEVGPGTYVIECDAYATDDTITQYVSEAKEFSYHCLTIDTAGHGNNIVLNDVLDGVDVASLISAAYLDDLNVAPDHPYIDDEGRALAAIALHPKNHYSTFWGLQADVLYQATSGIVERENPIVLNGDLTVYTVWFDIVKSIEVTVENPLCGAEVRAIDEIGRQTNAPVCTFAENCGYGLDELGSMPGAYWAQIDGQGTIHGDQHFEGVFEAENNYAFQINVMTDYGYVMPYGDGYQDVAVTVNGTPITGWSLRFYKDSYGCVFMSMVGKVKAVHDWDSSYTVDIAPTCSKEGSESIHCTACGAKQEGSDRAVATIPHNYGDWTVTLEPTCTTTGLHSKECADCGDVAEESIPALGHDYAQGTVTKATIDADGSIVDSTCSRCGDKTSQVIAHPTSFVLSSKSYTYNGSAKKPSVKVTDAAGAIIAAANYSVAYQNNVGAGTAKATISFKGDYYSGQKVLSFTINKAAQSITAKSTAKTLKATNGKLAKTKSYNLKKLAMVKAKTTVKLKKANKAGGKKITVYPTGKVNVKKGLKKGTYKVKVKLTAAANANYKAAKAKTITFKVVVK